MHQKSDIENNMLEVMKKNLKVYDERLVKIEEKFKNENKYETNKYYKVHTDGNNNRYTYIGNYFIDRETLDDYNAELVYVLDEILFKGKTHSKRGSGLTTIPEKVLKLEVCEDLNIKKEIKNIFIHHFRENIKNLQNKCTEN